MNVLPTIDEALALVLERVRPLSSERVPVGEAAGRFLAEDARAAVDLPPFDSSAMDGYAVRAADTPGDLTVSGQSAAGRPAQMELRGGEAIAISTGAVVPAGADAVVPIERVIEGDGVVTAEAVASGENVRPRGGDIRAHDVAATAGMRLGPAQVGALAACGIGAVACGRRPRVAILPTGSELRPAGAALAPGEIYESNSVLLAAQVRSAGGDAIVLDTVADDEGATRAALQQALAFDVLVTSGGVSVGPHDLVRALLAELGAREVFWRVAVKPGKPVAFATHGERLVFGLPGNPVSSLVAFELFVRPALLALQGSIATGLPFLPGRLARALPRNASRDELVRARAVRDGGTTLLAPVTGQESHMIARAAAADALVLVPRGEGELRRGDEVSWLQL